MKTGLDNPSGPESMMEKYLQQTNVNFQSDSFTVIPIEKEAICSHKHVFLRQSFNCCYIFMRDLKKKAFISCRLSSSVVF